MSQMYSAIIDPKDIKLPGKLEVNSSEEFRNHIPTLSTEGKRKWVYPKKPQGKFYNARSIVSLILLAILFGMPFIKIDGHPFMLFNIPEGKIIIAGMPFGPHDFYLLGLGMLTTIVFIALFTVVFGRLFCGWICPQTIFMEMFFRKIEYWIEGDSIKQQKLNSSPWTGEKLFKKGLKFTIFYLMAFVIANTFLSYIIGTDELFKIISEPVSKHYAGFIAIVIFSIVFFLVFAYMREQVCTLVCPYGRLQGVLLDRSSVLIIYDYLRGEPRGKIRKGDTNPKGDCVDCNLCVSVCPTGIDIRNGTQLECINCTACIDACDKVMEKTGRPKGLIRYDSTTGVEEGKRRIFTPRAISYSAILIVLVSVLITLISTRKDMVVSVLRTPGMFFQEQADGTISNVYNLNAVNKTYKDAEVRIELQGTKGNIKMLGGESKLEPLGTGESKLLISLPREEIKTKNTPLKLTVYMNDIEVDVVETSFMGPVSKP